MKNRFRLLILAALLALPSAVISDTDPWDTALSTMGYTRDNFHLDAYDRGYFGGDKYRLPFFDALWNEPLKIPTTVPTLANQILGASDSLGMLVMSASARMNAQVRRNLLGDPVEPFRKELKDPDFLPNAIDYVNAKSRVKVPAAEKVKVAAAAKKVPPEVAEAAALILTAAADSRQWLDLAFAGLPVKQRQALYDNSIIYVTGLDKDEATPEQARVVENSAGLVDFSYLTTGATDLAFALDAAAKKLSDYKGTTEFTFSAHTALGEVLINGSGIDAYAGKTSPLLILDTGGNDTYKTGAATGPTRPISIILDVSGNDTYESADPKAPSFGAGVLGYSFLVDLAGNDAYQSKSLTQGLGLYGVGALMDKGGNDTYSGFVGAQGAGFFGVGILADLNGDDSYTLYQQGQGFGWVLGSGLLVDANGNDKYVANDKDIKFPAAQSKEHNSSLAQGMGFGKRADYLDGHSLAGGVGFLVDGAGDDSYSCGIFGQGQAYWYGVGILADKSGNDKYNGVWYVQGAGAHFGVGVLWEGGGDDTYTATMNMAQGAGHDFTVGFLIDEAGNDTYNAPNLSLGGGNANGMGLFWDKAGDDKYNPSEGAGNTLGRAGGSAKASLREFMPTLGIFIDTGGGNDSYSKDFARNNTVWVQLGQTPLPSEKGVGLDE